MSKEVAAPSNVKTPEDKLLALYPEVFANREDMAKEVLQWFRNAHPKLSNLTVEAVYELSSGFRFGNIPAHYRIGGLNGEYYRFDNPHILAASQAVKDARAAAVQLLHAAHRYQKHWKALSGKTDQNLAAVVAAINKATVLKPPSKPKGGRPVNRWLSFVGFHAEDIEQILRVNGFPRASMASDSGPAPAVMANLLRWRLELEIAPATIARTWRAAKLANRGRDADPGETPVGFRPRAKQN